MKLSSLDRSMTLSIAAPGTGFALSLDGHVSLFDREGLVTGNIPPHLSADEIAEGIARHRIVDSPEQCPTCAAFVERNYSAEGERR